MKTPKAPGALELDPGGIETGVASVEPLGEGVAPSDETPGSAAGRGEGPDSSPGRVGRYLVISQLGKGGMGVVYEAFDPELDRRVALKRLHPDRALGTSRLRLLREAQAMARLSHPNVVQVYDVGVERDQVFMAMELVRGRTISQWLRAHDRTWGEIVAHFVEAGRGLEAAHAVDLIHRDFKPHNVLVGDDGRVKVADFGLAGAGDSLPASSAVDGPTTTSYLAASLTATGAVLGTPRYMAPEQHAGLEAGPASDQFAFCVALHEAIFRSHPYEGSTLVELATNVIEGNYRAPPDASAAPRWLQDAIRRGLAADPADRHASMSELLLVLEREPGRRRRRWLGAGALASSLGIACAAWFGMAGRAPCSGGQAEIATVWSTTQRQELSSAMSETGMPSAADPAVRALDAYAEAWADTHRAVCRQHRDASMSVRAFDSAMGCLQRARAAMGGVVQTVVTAQPEALRDAATAATSLPPLSHCRDRQRLALDAAPPEDPEQAQRVARLRERLARAEAIHDTGATAPALDELAAIAREVESLEHAPLTAEYALTSGRLAMDRLAWVSAQGDLSVASSRALASGADGIAAEAAARAVFVDAMLSDPDHRDPRGEQTARALVQRVGAPPNLQALVDNNVGVASALAGQCDVAVPLFERAVSLADTADDVAPADHSAYIMNLAHCTADPSIRDDLIARAQRLTHDALGPDHPRAIELALSRADHTVDRDVALERTTEVCQRARRRESVTWSRCVRCHLALADLHHDTGTDDRALAALAEGARCFDHVGEDEDPQFVQTWRDKVHGYAATLRGDNAEALATLEAAQDAMRPHAELPWVALDLADVTLLRARNLEALGRGDEAIGPLRSAITAYDEKLTRSYRRVYRDRREHARRLLARLEEAQRLRSIPSESSQR